MEKSLRKEKIFGNLEGEIVSVESNLSVDLIQNNYGETEHSFLRIQGIGALKQLRNYLNRTIYFIEKNNQ